jgi:undecaprenyl-diphosphatase
MLFIAFIGYVFIFFLKIVFNRPRPYEALGILSSIQKFEKSFPSSHAFLSAMLINFVPNEKWRKYFIIYAIAVAFSLVIIGVHYPSDVLVGGILGYIFPKYILPEEKIRKIKFLKRFGI